MTLQCERCNRKTESKYCPGRCAKCGGKMVVASSDDVRKEGELDV